MFSINHINKNVITFVTKIIQLMFFASVLTTIIPTLQAENNRISTTNSTTSIKNLFWNILYSGNDEKIPLLSKQLYAFYLENPANPDIIILQEIFQNVIYDGKFDRMPLLFKRMAGINFEKTDDSERNLVKSLFWDTFYSGNYEQIPRLVEQLTGYYLKKPNDPEITLLLAHTHLWRASESARLENASPSILDNLIIAKKFFDKAILLNPKDARIHGWSTSTEFSIGTIHQTPTWVDQGFRELVKTIDSYPEFNLFSAGFPMSSLPPTNPLFKQGIEFMWSGVEVCLEQANQPFDRNNPDYSSYMYLETDIGAKRVCWNNEKTPRGFEGFFLGFGDMLVKNGQPDVAKIMYANAKLSKTYESWSYKNVLEERIETAEERALAFESSNYKEHPVTLINSPISCVACHQK